MSRDSGVKAIVQSLVGVWNGTGEGRYPTIEPFTYRETTRFVERDDHPALHYEQRTWRQTSDGEVVSHWETGFLRFSSDGSVTMLNAQGGRAETMIGKWRKHASSWRIELTSTGYAGDDRVLRSTRSVQLDERLLTYQISMVTTSTQEMGLHLSAELSIAGDPKSR